MDKAQSNGMVSACSWPDAGKEAFYIHNSLLELASIGQIFCLCGIKAITIHALKTGRFMYAERCRKFKR